MTSALTLLMTRPDAASKRFVARLPDAVRTRVEICYSPLIRIVPLVEQLSFAGTGALIFTSSNAVELASRLTFGRTLPVYCVGRATTQAAQRAGWTATFAGATAEALIDTLTTLRPPLTLMHICGVHTRGDIANRLTAAGVKTTTCAIYDQLLEPFTPQANALLAGPQPVIAPIFSPRTARQFANMVPPNAPMWICALSDEVAKPLKSLRYQQMIVCQSPDVETMYLAIEKLVKRADRVESGPHAQ